MCVCVCVCVVESVARDSKPQYFPLQSCCFISFIERGEKRSAGWCAVQINTVVKTRVMAEDEEV